MKFLVALVMALALASVARGDDVNDLARAQEAYDRGIALKAQGKTEDARASFAESASVYRGLVAHGADNFGIHFNLGNASVQSDEIGHGIASYLRAQRFAPFDSALKANLTTARNDVRTKLSGSLPSELDSLAWWRVTGERSRAIVAIGAWSLFWVLLVPGLVGRRLPGALRALPATALVVALVFGASVGLDRAVEGLRPTGVIVLDNVVLRKGNGEGFAPQVEEALTKGVEFKLLERRPQWLRVELSDGTEGWIRENQADVV